MLGSWVEAKPTVNDKMKFTRVIVRRFQTHSYILQSRFKGGDGPLNGFQKTFLVLAGSERQITDVWKTVAGQGTPQFLRGLPCLVDGLPCIQNPFQVSLQRILQLPDGLAA